MIATRISRERTRAVGYIRVSTEKQAEHGVSLDAQRAKLEAYAALYEIDLVEVVVDAGVSAKTLARPGLDRARTLLRADDVSAIVVVKLDRLTRSVRDLGTLVDEQFVDGRPALLSVSEQIDTRSAAGRLVLNVLASLGQWERESAGERTAAALAYKASRGEFIGGGVPFGYRLAEDGVRLVEHEPEQRTLATAAALRARGLTLARIAIELERGGMLTRSRRRFSVSQVARLVTREAA